MTEQARTYTVTRTRGCRVIAGWVPITDMAALMRAWSDASQHAGDEWVVDAELSQQLAVNMVCGPRSATAAWRVALGLTPPPLNESKT
jgi:hypothetical protein